MVVFVSSASSYTQLNVSSTSSDQIKWEHRYIILYHIISHSFAYFIREHQSYSTTDNDFLAHIHIAHITLLVSNKEAYHHNTND